LYSAPKKEITALAVDADGNIYAAGAGEKRGTTPQPGAPAGKVGVVLAPQGSAPASGIQVTPATPSGAASPPLVTPVPSVASLGGSEIYRLSPDGSPKTLWSSRDDLVYALAFDGSRRLLAGSGNRGEIYAIARDEHTDLAEASATQVTAFAPAPKGGLYVATSNVGKIFVLGPNSVNEGTYESDVFDAKNFSRWGRVEVRGSGNFQLFARSGNVDNPDRNWSPWKPVDLPKNLAIDAPPARFIQWKAELRPAKSMPALDSVTVNYLPKNVAPEVDDVMVLVGSRVSGSPRTDTADSTGNYSTPISTVKDKDSIAVTWKAQDDNSDSLVYDVYYRGDGETQWKLLRNNVFDRYVNLDPDLFPDGGYTIRVVASDAPSHAASDALAGDATSSRFEVDNSPPRIEAITAKVEGDNIHVSFRAVDTFSPINQAEYSIDAGDWQMIEPVGEISDSKTESYDFTIALPQNTNGSSEHTIIVRAYDRFDNLGTGKVVVNAAGR
jgi:hypothetical protein